MKKIIAITVLALALILSWPIPGMAICLLDVCPPPPSSVGRAASIGAGPWIVGGVGLSALSVIVRAAVVSGQQHRELTSSEAIGAIALPFVWVFIPGEPVIPGNPITPSGRRTPGEPIHPAFIPGEPIIPSDPIIPGNPIAPQ